MLRPDANASGTTCARPLAISRSPRRRTARAAGRRRTRAARRPPSDRARRAPPSAARRRTARTDRPAVAGARLVAELALEIAGREAGAPAGLHRQVPEEARLAVGAVQAPERVGVRLSRRVLSNPRQVLVDPHLTRHPSW